MIAATGLELVGNVAAGLLVVFAAWRLLVFGQVEQNREADGRDSHARLMAEIRRHP